MHSDATTVARLKQAGAIIMGKTVTTQFASLHPAGTRTREFEPLAAPDTGRDCQGQ